MKQLKAKILSNKSVGQGFYRMRLWHSYLALAARAGQFVEIRCSSLTDPLLRRPLGVHRIWPDGIEVLYEVVGEGTALLAQKRPGEELDLIGPLGNGFDLSLSSEINILVAGGIGVAPLLSLAESLSAEKSKVHVMIGARKKSHVMCEKEFRLMGCFVKVSTDDGSKGYKGLVTEPLKKLIEACKPEDVTVYACGPTGMLKAVRAITHKNGISCQVSLEERMACGVGVCLGCPVKVKAGGYKMVCKDGPVFNAEELAW